MKCTLILCFYAHGFMGTNKLKILRQFSGAVRKRDVTISQQNISKIGR